MPCHSFARLYLFTNIAPLLSDWRGSLSGTNLPGSLHTGVYWLKDGQGRVEFEYLHALLQKANGITVSLYVYDDAITKHRVVNSGTNA